MEKAGRITIKTISKHVNRFFSLKLRDMYKIPKGTQALLEVLLISQGMKRCAINHRTDR
jgi:hypothetical protein